MTATADPFAGWAILELMGHRRLAGYVREVELAGTGLLRLDVPDPTLQGVALDPLDPECWSATQFYSPAALYCLTPTTEDVARKVAAGSDPAPVKRWELPTPSVTSGLDRTYQERLPEFEDENAPL
jgi:hypothetical protein